MSDHYLVESSSEKWPKINTQRISLLWPKLLKVIFELMFVRRKNIRMKKANLVKSFFDKKRLSSFESKIVFGARLVKRLKKSIVSNTIRGTPTNRLRKPDCIKLFSNKSENYPLQIQIVLPET